MTAYGRGCGDGVSGLDRIRMRARGQEQRDDEWRDDAREAHSTGEGPQAKERVVRQVSELLEALGDIVQLCRLRERVAESSAHQRMRTEGVHKIVILGVTVERRAVHCAVGPGRPRRCF